MQSMNSAPDNSTSMNCSVYMASQVQPDLACNSIKNSSSMDGSGPPPLKSVSARSALHLSLQGCSEAQGNVA